MRRTAVVLLALCANLTAVSGPVQSATPNPVRALAPAARFLPPGCDLASLYTFNYKSGRVSRTWPAVLEAPIVGADSRDVVFAYYCPKASVVQKTLFVTLLHQTPKGYQKVYEVSYRARVLFVPRAMKILHLREVHAAAVAVITAPSAALGGQLDVFVWLNPWGWKNIFPPNGGIEYFYFFSKPDGLTIALSSARHPGLEVSPPPVWYRWDGKQFLKISPPPGSSKWARDDE